MKRILVTGAAGAMGSYVPEVFHDADLTLTDIQDELPRLDVRDPHAVVLAFRELRPQFVLHLAAATDVDRCEQDPDWAYHTNAIGTQNVALACQAHGAVLVYVSTAGVFWGDKPEPYNEYDLPRPANVYGNSKLAGEHCVASLLRQFYTVRAGWMMGGVKKDKKFVGKIGRMMLAGEQRLRVVDDKVGSPTYARDFVRGIRRLLETGYYGLYHMVNTGSGSRYEVALAMRDALGCNEISIEPISSAHMPLPAPRARSEAMDNLKLRLLGLNQMRPWRAALSEYLESEFIPSLRGNRS